MAGFAGALESPVVRIAVASCAAAERQTEVLHFSVRTLGFMALLAGHLGVSPRQPIAGFGMIKLRHRCPVIQGMALLAVCSQPAPVLVCVAAYAGARQAQIGQVQILHLDRPSLGWRNVAGVMALLAGERGVFALQRVACLGMVEGFLGRLPVDQLKVDAVMLRVTPHAVPAGALGSKNRAVIAGMGGDPPGNLVVALQALEASSWASCQPMATGAARRSFQKLVRFGERPRGDLPRRLASKARATEQGNRDASNEWTELEPPPEFLPGNTRQRRLGPHLTGNRNLSFEA